MLSMEGLRRLDRLWAVDGVLADGSGSGRVRHVHSVDPLLELRRLVLLLKEFPKRF